MNPQHCHCFIITCCLLRFPSQTRSTSPPFRAIAFFTLLANSIASSPYQEDKTLPDIRSIIYRGAHSRRFQRADREQPKSKHDIAKLCKLELNRIQLYQKNPVPVSICSTSGGLLKPATVSKRSEKSVISRRLYLLSVNSDSAPRKRGMPACPL